MLLTSRATETGHVKHFLSSFPHQVRHLDHSLTAGAFRPVSPKKDVVYQLADKVFRDTKVSKWKPRSNTRSESLLEEIISAIQKSFPRKAFLLQRQFAVVARNAGGVPHFIDHVVQISIKNRLFASGAKHHHVWIRVGVLSTEYLH